MNKTINITHHILEEKKWVGLLLRSRRENEWGGSEVWLLLLLQSVGLGCWISLWLLVIFIGSGLVNFYLYLKKMMEFQLFFILFLSFFILISLFVLRKRNGKDF
jgi:hypothetical protein